MVVMRYSAEALSAYEYVITQTFGSKEEGVDFYNNYALGKGFSVRKCYLERIKGTEQVCLKKLVCSRQGFREGKHMKRTDRKRRARNLTRCGCEAKLVIMLNQETGRWFVKDFMDEHNHCLAPVDQVCFLRSHCKISDAQKADILEMEVGVRKHQIMNIMEKQFGGYDNVGFVSRDIYNYCYQYKQETIVAGAAQTVLSHLRARQERDPDFFFKYEIDKQGHLKHLFWSDSQSRLDYEAFGQVVVFDSTYRINRYNLPFVPFVGLNHHRSTVIFGCSIVSDESGEAYEWLLTTFLTCMAQKYPISVITDGDLAMQRAIKAILPNCNHRLRTWHIEQNIIRHLHDSEVSHDFRKFLYDYCSTHEFESKWIHFREKHDITSADTWLHQMYEMRMLWAAAYQKGLCFLGLKSNQQIESLNSTLHAHLDGQMTLFRMMHHYEECLSNLRRNEAKLDSEASQSVPFTELDASNIEKDAAHLYTPTVFALVKEEICGARKLTINETLDGGDLRIYVISLRERRERKFHVDCSFSETSLERVSCSCCKLQSEAIPCSHIFYVFSILHIEELPRG